MVKAWDQAKIIRMEERLHCGDDRVHPDQWRKLVNHGDEDLANKRSATNKINRKNLKMSHTVGTTTFAQIRHQYMEKHGVQYNQVTFFVMTHTRGKGDNRQPIDEASREMMSRISIPQPNIKKALGDPPQQGQEAPQKISCKF
ncbi:uncharacterized protein Pyn_21402 [Prunus yedoensis var. nudiflora]|uniref:Uncharacterized protein n=1 Tax=Prunus yedoensis var. nudiflora TaxID=2094558 RepID=A0A314ZKM1_PRUYE|nr:uncharacterized protein Pyn_21402 [Prunus yedoensis var. nudiflora]